jgi:hypothetical protein
VEAPGIEPSLRCGKRLGNPEILGACGTSLSSSVPTIPPETSPVGAQWGRKDLAKLSFMHMKHAALLLLVGCASPATITPDPDARETTNDSQRDASSTPSPTPTSKAGADPVQLETKEQACEGTSPNGVSRYAEVSYPGLTKAQILDSVHVAYSPLTSTSYPNGYDTVQVTLLAKDGAAAVQCGSPSQRVLFVRRL